MRDQKMVFSLGPTEKTLWNTVDNYSQGHCDTGSQNEFYVAMSYKTTSLKPRMNPMESSLKPHIGTRSEREDITTNLRFSRSVVYNSLQPHGLQHARLPSPSPTSGAYSNSCPWNR